MTSSVSFFLLEPSRAFQSHHWDNLWDSTLLPVSLMLGERHGKGSPSEPLGGTLWVRKCPKSSMTGVPIGRRERGYKHRYLGEKVNDDLDSLA